MAACASWRGRCAPPLDRTGRGIFRCPLLIRPRFLAPQGYVAVDLGIKFPGEKYAGLSSFTAHEATAKYELFLLLLLVGTSETIGFSQIYGEDSSREVGDFGFDPLKLLTPETTEKYKLAELTHGRLAMLAFSGVVTQSALGHTTFPYVA